MPNNRPNVHIPLSSMTNLNLPISACGNLIFLLVLFHQIVSIHGLCDNTSNGPQIYDRDTAQCYPISKTSLQFDLVFTPSKPDDKEFPPEYLNSLLNQCDDPMPTYRELLIKAWISFKEFGLNWTRYPFTIQMFYRYLMVINPLHIIQVLSLGVLLSVVRYALEKYTYMPLINNIGLSQSSARKMIESTWKAIWFTVMWLISFKILILSGKRDFYYPRCILENSSFQVGLFDIPLPPDYNAAYILQLGYYIHAFWAVFFMDTWRKDSIVTAVHHVLTCLLLECSVINRFHRAGLLVLFCHDISDVFLEIAKINVCLKFRFGKVHRINAILSNTFFAMFTFTWVLFRLYWFPLKVLHATTWGAYIIAVGREARGYLFLNTMLWTLFVMHLYWFSLIVRMIPRIIFNPSDKVSDVREYDSDEEQQFEHPNQDVKDHFSNGHINSGRTKDD